MQRRSEDLSGGVIIGVRLSDIESILYGSEVLSKKIILLGISLAIVVVFKTFLVGRVPTVEIDTSFVGKSTEL